MTHSKDLSDVLSFRDQQTYMSEAYMGMDIDAKHFSHDRRAAR